MAPNPDQITCSKVFCGWIIAFSLLVIYLLADGVSLTVPPVLYPRLIKEFGATKELSLLRCPHLDGCRNHGPFCRNPRGPFWPLGVNSLGVFS